MSGPVHCPHCDRLVSRRGNLCPECGIHLNPHALLANPVERAVATASFLRRLKTRHPVARLIVTLLVTLFLLTFGALVVGQFFP